MAQGTRGRQQEEQLATVIAVLREQGEKQEQVAEEQRQLHAELSAQFRQQVDQLAHNQQRTWEMQQVMEGRMNALEGELRATREAAFGRLDKAEEQLRGVVKTETDGHGTATQDAVTGGLQHSQSGGNMEMQTEEGPRDSLTSYQGSGAVTRPPAFDGKMPWDAYYTQFEMLARINGWSDAEKATYLAVSLRGPALTVLSNISAEHLYDFQSLVSALDARFGSAHQAELNRMRLKCHTRRREESLPELAEDIERLTRLAYPNAAASMIELLAKDQFVDAIPDDEMRLKIRQNRPESLRQTLETALELESYQLASLRRVKPVRAATVSDEKSEDSATRGSVSEHKPQWVDDLVRSIQQCLHEASGDKRPSTPARDPRRRRTICWKCGKPGHLQRNCPDQAQDAGMQGNGHQPDL